MILVILGLIVYIEMLLTRERWEEINQNNDEKSILTQEKKLIVIRRF